MYMYTSPRPSVYRHVTVSGDSEAKRTVLIRLQIHTTVIQCAVQFRCVLLILQVRLTMCKCRLYVNVLCIFALYFVKSSFHSNDIGTWRPIKLNECNHKAIKKCIEQHGLWYIIYEFKEFIKFGCRLLLMYLEMYRDSWSITVCNTRESFVWFQFVNVYLMTSIHKSKKCFRVKLSAKADLTNNRGRRSLRAPGNQGSHLILGKHIWQMFQAMYHFDLRHTCELT